MTAAVLVEAQSVTTERIMSYAWWHNARGVGPKTQAFGNRCASESRCDEPSPTTV